MHGTDVERSGDRLGNRPIESADQGSHDLSDDEAKRVSAEHGDDWRTIESPHDQTFEHKAKRTNHKRGRHHSEPDRQARAVHDVSDIGAKQDELSLSEPDSAPHAGDDAEPEDDQPHDRTETQYLEKCDDQISHGLPPASHYRSLHPGPVA